MAKEETCKLDDTTSNEYKANCGAGSANARKKLRDDQATLLSHEGRSTKASMDLSYVQQCSKTKSLLYNVDHDESKASNSGKIVSVGSCSREDMCVMQECR